LQQYFGVVSRITKNARTVETSGRRLAKTPGQVEAANSPLDGFRLRRSGMTLAKEGECMNKRLSLFVVVFKLMLLGMAVFIFVVPQEANKNALWLYQTVRSQSVADIAPKVQYAPDVDFIAGICALLLMGYLFWIFIRKFQSDSREERIARENSLYDISLATGRTEYDLFHLSAKGWSVSGETIERDFTRYMANQVTPHYVKDFIRKNRTQVDDSLIKEKDARLTSWSDWAKALAVFPGSIVLLVALCVLLG
jgi:hypothetical protein